MQVPVHEWSCMTISKTLADDGSGTFVLQNHVIRDEIPNGSDHNILRDCCSGAPTKFVVSEERYLQKGLWRAL